MRNFVLITGGIIDNFLRMRCVWAALCGIVLLHLLSLDGLTDSPVGGCSQFDSCNGCISGDPALNLTRCVWQSCNDGKETHIAYELKCILLCNVSVVCAHTHTEDPTEGHQKCTYLLINVYTTPGSGPDFSQASFDLSSFIGGIILVLVLQAGAFFAMRFLKTKDSSYETM
uniref:CD164 molecule, sialomucin n=1 Tax=Sinocyclocheilus rhinocerous TaxID=307959 RepID=A0A673IQ24_9TELE